MEGLTLTYRPTTTGARTIKFFQNLFNESSKNLITLTVEKSEPTLFVLESQKSTVYGTENKGVFGIYRYGGHKTKLNSTECAPMHILSEIFYTRIPTTPLFTICENPYFPDKIKIDNPIIKTDNDPIIEVLYRERIIPNRLILHGIWPLEEIAREKAEKLALEKMHIYAKTLDLPTLDQVVKE